MNFKRFSLSILLGIIVLLPVACRSDENAFSPAVSGTPTIPIEIKIGSLNDLTGATSDVGRDYALGIQEAVNYYNENGGINGKAIRLQIYDYGYFTPGAVATYKYYRDAQTMNAILGWATNDTVALASLVAQDKMPFVSASYAGTLTDPAKTPYNFFAAPDYSTGARAAITVWYNEVWLKSKRFEARRSANDKPRFVCFYDTASAFGQAPIKAIKEQAALLGFEIGPDQNIGMSALNAQTQVLAAKNFKPDLVWHGNTTSSVAVALQEEKQQKLGADNIVNTQGFDENLINLAGPAAEGAIGVAPSAFYGEKVKGMDLIVAAAQKYHPNTLTEKRTIQTVKAWANVTILKKALELADKAGQLNGEGIRVAFESFKDLDVGFGVAPLTWTATDHRPTSFVNIYQVKDGDFVKLKTINMKTAFPKDWSQWLGY